MPVEFITARWIKGLKPKPGQTKDILFFDKTPGMKGFHVTLSPSGGKTWGLKYVSPELVYPEGHKFAGQKRQRVLSLGTYYDDGDGITFAAAAKRVREIKGQLDEGKDPQEQRVRDGHARASAKTVADVAKAWATETETRDDIVKKTAKAAVATVKNHVLPILGSYLIADVKGIHYDDVMVPHREICKTDSRHKPVTNRIHFYMGDLFDYAVRKGMIEFNPFASEKSPFTKMNQGTRFFDRDEIRKFWEVTDKMTARSTWAQRHTGPVLQILLATGQRIGSVCQMKRDCIDVENKLWVIPMTDLKNGERKRVNHPVPLNALAWKVVEAAMKATDGNVLFPDAKGNPVKVVKIDTTVRESQIAFDMPKWTPHALRHTFVTWTKNKKQGGCALNRTDIKRTIAHSIKEDRDTMGSTYDHNDLFEDHEYIEEITAVQETWGRWLDNVLEPQDGGNVVPLPRKVA